MKRGKSRNISRWRNHTAILISFLGVSLIVSSVASAAALEGFSLDPLGQELASYAPTTVAVTNFPNPPNITQVGMPLNTVKTLYASNSTVSGNTFDAYISAEGSTGTVLAGDWAEKFVFHAPLTGVVAATDNFTLYSQFSSTIGTNFGPLNYTFSITFTSANLLFSTVTIYVDYGLITPPSSVTTLIITIQQT